MVHLGGCDLVLLAGMVLTLVTGVSSKPGLLPRLDGTLQWIQCLCNIRVIGSISNSSNHKLWYIVIWKIFHFGRVLFVLILKGNILLVIVRIFHFGRCSVPGSGFPVISLWEDVEVLEGKVCDIIGISWHLGLRCDLFLLSDVPSSVRIL